jgi:Ca-activated chloride channel family protein
MLAVDISDSMDTTDIVYNGRYINRLNAVKLVVGNFVEHRLNDRLGLILFGSNAYIQAPLTYDRNTVGTLLWEAQLRFAGPTTAIGDAIGLAAKRLRDQQQENRVLIVLTDGENTAGEISPLNGADLAARLNIKVYTIGFGRNDREIDEETLLSVAEKTGGRYFRARNLEQLVDIHNELNRLEPVEQDTQSFRPVRALFYWPLAVALIFSLMFAASHWLRHRSGENSAPASARAEINL